MVKWRNTRLPKLEGESEITSVFEMVVNHTYELGFLTLLIYDEFSSPKQPNRPHTS